MFTRSKKRKLLTRLMKFHGKLSCDLIKSFQHVVKDGKYFKDLKEEHLSCANGELECDIIAFWLLLVAEISHDKLDAAHAQYCIDHGFDKETKNSFYKFAGARYKQYTDAFNADIDSPEVGMSLAGYIQAALQEKESPDGKLAIVIGDVLGQPMIISIIMNHLEMTTKFVSQLEAWYSN